MDSSLRNKPVAAVAKDLESVNQPVLLAVDLVTKFLEIVMIAAVDLAKKMNQREREASMLLPLVSKSMKVSPSKLSKVKGDFEDTPLAVPSTLFMSK